MSKKQFFDTDELPISSGKLPPDYPDRGRNPFPERDLRGINPENIVDSINLNIEFDPGSWMGLGTLISNDNR